MNCIFVLFCFFFLHFSIKPVFLIVNVVVTFSSAQIFVAEHLSLMLMQYAEDKFVFLTSLWKIFSDSLQK